MAENYLVPETIENNDNTKPAMDDSSLGGGFRVVDSVAERNAIALDKRKIGAIVSYGTPITPHLYGGVDVTDVNWENDNNWSLITAINPAQWDDISGALIASRLDTSSGRLDYDYFNAGVNFNSNARYPDDPVVIPIQAKHAMVIGAGAVARPHFHWIQEQSDAPNMLLGVKITNYGSATVKETDWSNYLFFAPTGNAFTYPGGVFAQITKFPEINISSLTISGSVDFVLFRDSTNASGLFIGSDPVAADVTIKYNDSHVKFNSAGSTTELTK